MLYPSWLWQLLLGLFLLFDSYLGLIHGAGIITWSGLIIGQLKWLTLSAEMLAGGLVLLRTMLNQAKPGWRGAVVISAQVLPD